MENVFTLVIVVIMCLFSFVILPMWKENRKNKKDQEYDEAEKYAKVIYTGSINPDGLGILVEGKSVEFLQYLNDLLLVRNKSRKESGNNLDSLDQYIEVVQEELKYRG
jgi:hypothetical protein